MRGRRGRASAPATASAAPGSHQTSTDGPGARERGAERGQAGKPLAHGLKQRRQRRPERLVQAVVEGIGERVGAALLERRDQQRGAGRRVHRVGVGHLGGQRRPRPLGGKLVRRDDGHELDRAAAQAQRPRAARPPSRPA